MSFRECTPFPACRFAKFPEKSGLHFARENWVALLIASLGSSDELASSHVPGPKGPVSGKPGSFSSTLRYALPRPRVDAMWNVEYSDSEESDWSAKLTDDYQPSLFRARDLQSKANVLKLQVLQMSSLDRIPHMGTHQHKQKQQTGDSRRCPSPQLGTPKARTLSGKHSSTFSSAKGVDLHDSQS